MNYKTLFETIKILVVLSILTGIGMTQSLGKRSAGEKEPAIRYVIVHNEIDPSLGEGDSERRFVEILMDSRVFTKRNVAVLGERVSKRFLNPSLLYINVFTSLDDVETPEERDGPKISNSASDGPNRKATATCVRINNNLRCLIYFADGKHDEVQVKL